MSNEHNKFEELQLEEVTPDKPMSNEDKLKELLKRCDLVLEKIKIRKLKLPT